MLTTQCLLLVTACVMLHITLSYRLWSARVPSPVLANSILAYDVSRTEDVGLSPSNSGSMLGQRCSPLLVQCRSIVYDAGPTLIHHWVCRILYANTWHSPNAVLMLIHSLRSWPVIETALRDCTVFSDCSFCRQPFTSRHQIHWSNADVMLGNPMRRWANIIPT